MGKNIVGFQIRTNNMEAMDTIHEHWMHYEEVKHRLPSRAREIYVVYSNFENGMDGDYDYLIGREMPVGFEVSDDMTVIEIPDPSEMQAFEAKGEMPEALIEVWGTIWSKEDTLKRKFEIDYELYPLSNKKLATVYIGVKKS